LGTCHESYEDAVESAKQRPTALVDSLAAGGSRSGTFSGPISDPPMTDVVLVMSWSSNYAKNVYLRRFIADRSRDFIDCPSCKVPSSARCS